MLENYFPILMFILVGVVVGVAPVALGGGLSRLVGVHRPDPEKLSPYECGFEAFEDARMKFDVRYYLVAILFVLFDLEIAFLFLTWGCVPIKAVNFSDTPRHAATVCSSRQPVIAKDSRPLAVTNAFPIF